MVKPERGFSEAVRQRVIELTGKDPGRSEIMDIFPGLDYFRTSFSDRVESIAQSMVRIANGDCEILYPKDTTLDGDLPVTKL